MECFADTVVFRYVASAGLSVSNDHAKLTFKYTTMNH